MCGKHCRIESGSRVIQEQSGKTLHGGEHPIRACVRKPLYPGRRLPTMRLLLTLVCLTSAVCAETLPQIEGENLMGRKIVLPEAAAGHRAILVIGFSHASQGQTKAWAERLDREFPNPSMVTVYPLAVLEAVPRLVRGMASHGIKSSTPKEQRDRFLLVYQKEAELKMAAGFTAPDDAYILLLDASGAIRWRFHGPVTDSAIAELQKEAQAAA